MKTKSLTLITFFALMCLLSSVIYGKETEVLEKRSFTAKTYRLEDGRYKKVLSVKPMHYRDGNGQFQEISKGDDYEEQMNMAIEQMKIGTRSLAKSSGVSLSNSGSYSKFKYQRENPDSSYKYEYGYGYDDGSTIGNQIVSDPVIYVDSIGPEGIVNENWRALFSWNTDGLGISEDGTITVDSLELRIDYTTAFVTQGGGRDFTVQFRSIGVHAITEYPNSSDYNAISSSSLITSEDFSDDDSRHSETVSRTFSSGPFFTDFVDCWENQKSNYTMGFKHDTESYDDYETPPESDDTYLEGGYITIYYHVKEVKLVNRRKSEPESNLGGTLSLDNLVGHTDYLNKASGTSVPVYVDENYTVKTHNERLTDGTIDVKHHNWYFNNNYKMVNENFDMKNYYTKLDAEFDVLSTVTLSSDIGKISIRDPWYVSDPVNFTQPDTYREISSGDYELFLNQNPEDGPCYTLRVDKMKVTTSDIYVFDHWSGSDVDFGGGATTTTNIETNVVFKAANASVTANYVSANATGRTVTVSSGETLTPPPNATYNITPGNFGIDVYGALIINQSTSQPVIFQSNAASPSKSDWNGIKTHNGSTLLLRNVTLKNARNPIWIFSNNSSETRYIENCTVDNCLNGIIFDGYYSTSENLNETLTITNNVIKDIGNSTNRNPGIYVDGTFEELNVENNEILNCYGGIKASFQYASKNQVIGPQILINHNTIHDLASSGDPAIGIEVIDTTPQYFTLSNTVPYGEIQNNTFDNIDGYEIYTDLTCPLYWQVQNKIPDAPYLQTISKDANDHPVLTWTPPGDNDIQKYIVFKQYTNSSGTESWTVDVGLATTWTDNGITLTKFGNTTAIYKVKAVDNVDQESAYSNSRAVDGDGPLWKPVSEIPKEFALHQAYPNPFNPSTQISFDIPSETKVLIELYDLLGQKVRTLVQTNCHPGYHRIVWDGKNDNGNPMSAGTYFIKMVTGEYQKPAKCTLIK
jgi:hypothetical protein